MAFERNRTIAAHDLHQLAGKRNRVDMVVVGIHWTFENLGKAAANEFELMHGIADHHAADGRAANHDHLKRERLQNRHHGAASDHETAEYHDEQNDNSNGCKHA